MTVSMRVYTCQRCFLWLLSRTRPPEITGEPCENYLYMAHRCGFTQKVLTATLQASGFKSVASMARGYPYFDLWAVASKEELPEEQIKALALEHMTPV